ncbi:MAG: Na/Pi cotransporter family protein, partial [Planctomycetota bacterium]|nr:Na/Pi cotransporter family protein [Planctomycetota bacterium]
TIALAASGTISFQTALALVLGENVGTTITALLAGVTANDSARRAAIAHAIFNICGVFIISLVFWKYMNFIEYIIAGDAD